MTRRNHEPEVEEIEIFLIPFRLYARMALVAIQSPQKYPRLYALWRQSYAGEPLLLPQALDDSPGLSSELQRALTEAEKRLNRGLKVKWAPMIQDIQARLSELEALETPRRNPDPHAEVEALYHDFARERDRIAVALGEGYGSVLGCWDEEPCPDDNLDRVRRAGAYLANYDPEIFKQTKRGRELREHLRAWVRWLAWMADRCEERVAEGWWVEAGGWEAPRGHGRR